MNRYEATKTEIEMYTEYLKSLKYIRLSTMFTTLSMLILSLVTIHMKETLLGEIVLIIGLVALYMFLAISWNCIKVAKAIKTLEKYAHEEC